MMVQSDMNAGFSLGVGRQGKRGTLTFHGTDTYVFGLWTNIQSAIYRGLKIE